MDGQTLPGHEPRYSGPPDGSQRSDPRRQRAGRCLRLGFAVALAAALSGCTAAPPGPGKEKTLRLAWSADVRSLDPATAVEGGAWSAVRLVNQGLLDYGEGTDLVPCLARELPQVSADGCTYTFRLRRGIRFSNGRELTAEDCVYTLERLLEPGTKSWGEAFFRGIAGTRAFQAARERDAESQRGLEPHRRKRLAEPTRVEGLRAPDRYTFQVRLEAPDLSFPYKMTVTPTYIVPKEEVQRWGEEFFRHPVGTGAYVLKEWRRGASLRYERNRLHTGDTHPHPDAVHVLLGTDTLTQQMMFERGELDYLGNIPTADFVRITSDPKWKSYVMPRVVTGMEWLFLNCEMPPFTDRRVRQAMNYALDKERLIGLLNGRAVASRGILPPQLPGHNPDLKGYPYDASRARRLLDEAGYRDGFSVPLLVGANSEAWMKLAQGVQGQLAEVGIKVELRVVSPATYVSLITRRRTTQLGFASWWCDYPDPNNIFDALLCGEQITEHDCLNAAFYRNPVVDALLAEARRETDREHRSRLYQRAEALIFEDAPWVFLYHPAAHGMRQPWLKGCKPHPVWPECYERWWIEEPRGPGVRSRRQEDEDAAPGSPLGMGLPHDVRHFADRIRDRAYGAG